MSKSIESGVGSPSTSEEIVIEARDVAVSFGMARGESKVVDDVDLDIRRNEILGIVGESGSGKSMLASSLLDAVIDPGTLTGSVTYHPSDGEPVDIVSASESELKRLRWEEISFAIQGAQSAFNVRLRARHARTVSDTEQEET